MTTNDILLAVAFILALVLVILRLNRRRRQREGAGRDPFVEALRHLIDGEDDLAYSRLVETVRLDTSNIDAYIVLGDILRRRGDYERALKVHRDVTIRSALSPSTNRTVLKSLALDYAALGRWGAAEETLLKLDRLSKKDLWPRLHLLEVYEAQRKWSNAFELGMELEEEPGVTGSRLAGYKVEQARDLIKQGAYHKSRIILKEALKHDSACAEAFLAIGDTYSEEGRTEEAVQWWEKMVEIVPERSTEAFSCLEDALYQLGAFSRMADIYTRHLNANPDSAEAALALAHLLERKGEVGEAIEVLNTHRPHTRDAHLLDQAIARLHYRSGDTQRALELVFGDVTRRVEQQEQVEADFEMSSEAAELIVEDEVAELEDEEEESAV